MTRAEATRHYSNLSPRLPPLPCLPVPCLCLPPARDVWRAPFPTSCPLSYCTPNQAEEAEELLPSRRAREAEAPDGTRAHEPKSPSATC